MEEAWRGLGAQRGDCPQNHLPLTRCRGRAWVTCHHTGPGWASGAQHAHGSSGGAMFIPTHTLTQVPACVCGQTSVCAQAEPSTRVWQPVCGPREGPGAYAATAACDKGSSGPVILLNLTLGYFEREIKGDYDRYCRGATLPGWWSLPCAPPEAVRALDRHTLGREEGASELRCAPPPQSLPSLYIRAGLSPGGRSHGSS